MLLQQEEYENLVSQMAVLNPRNWVHPRFGENKVKSLCKTFHLNNQEIHHGFIEYKSIGGRSIFNNNNINNNNDISLRTHGPYHRHESTKKWLAVHQRTLQKRYLHMTNTGRSKAVYPLHSCIVIRKSTENG